MKPWLIFFSFSYLGFLAQAQAQVSSTSCAYAFGKANLENAQKTSSLEAAINTAKRLFPQAVEQCDKFRQAVEVPQSGVYYGLENAVSEVFGASTLIKLTPIKQLAYQLNRNFQLDHLVRMNMTIFPVDVDGAVITEEQLDFTGKQRRYRVARSITAQGLVGSLELIASVYKDLSDGSLYFSISNRGIPLTSDGATPINPIELSDLRNWFD